jgi:hypothetical protein
MNSFENKVILLSDKSSFISGAAIPVQDATRICRLQCRI